MPHDISKDCSDFLRAHAADAVADGRLKASHARELVAAFFGYNTHAALLSESDYPLHQLDEAAVLVPDVRLMNQRRSCLNGLPDLPNSIELAKALVGFLASQHHFSGKAWIYDSLESYVMEVLLPEEDPYISDCLSGVMAETNAYFDEAYYESAEVQNVGDAVEIAVTGSYNGSNDEDRPFCGDQIDMIVTVNLPRVAGKAGFGHPDISASGSVNDDWVDPELRFPADRKPLHA
ncbi:hypothetical protein [Solimonas terrae]|uniref:Uncharacterized protein n=1 Tax=Solimonas terrae TaxID=1396819 RepID=A0A6M2BUZ5_9GAMM|nr:hypothetical protein [Solimonas terrae]NGY05943.1 hypothetical protein [Solimonas terrae]